ncbi:MAG: radical SAM family heme chaperone HemW, partial [Psychrobacter sp.]
IEVAIGATIKMTTDDEPSTHHVTEANKESRHHLLTESGIYRFSKSRLPKDYMDYQSDPTSSALSQNAPKMVGWKVIASDEMVSEFMLNALRLHDGIAWSTFTGRTGVGYDEVSEQVEKLVTQGLLKDDTERLQPTVLGQRYLNQILREFL